MPHTQQLMTTTSRISIRSIKNREDLVTKLGMSKSELAILLDNKDISLYDETLEKVALKTHKNHDFLIQAVGKVYDEENREIEIKLHHRAPLDKIADKRERITLIKNASKKETKLNYEDLKRKPAKGSKSEKFIKAFFSGKSIYKIAQDAESPYSFVRGVLLRYNIIKEKE